MRRLLFVSSLLLSPGFAWGAAPSAPPGGAPLPAIMNRAATTEEIALLTDALTKVAREMNRWAYTETTLIRDEKGKVKQDKIVRHDPSRPYAEQDLPSRIDGKPPTEAQLKEYRSRGEKRGRRIEKGEQVGRENISGQSVGDLVDLNQALIVGDDGTRLTYELPLRKVGNTRFPPEKFQVLVQVIKDGHRLERAGVTLREPLRTKLIVKIASGEASADFTLIDPKYGPAMTAVRGSASASIFFYHVGGSGEVTRTDLKHVRPFAERFEVQIGPLKALDF
jgi:hypothetical protein